MKGSRTIIALGAVAILLTGISGDACLAQTQTPPNRGPITAFTPRRYNCLDLLELERLAVNPQTNTLSTFDYQLAADYYAVSGWLQGFLTAQNVDPNSDGNVAKGATIYQITRWIFSYCRAHPSENLLYATIEFLNAVHRDSTTRK